MGEPHPAPAVDPASVRPSDLSPGRGRGPRSDPAPPVAPGYPDVRFVDVPPRRMLMIEGSGSPEGEPGFRQAIEALYPVAYTLHFALKRGRGVAAPIGALEALWFRVGDVEADLDGSAGDGTGPGRDDAEPEEGGPAWSWTAMLPLPAEATDAEIDAAIDDVRAKKAPSALDRLRVGMVDEGLVAEITHVGPYDAETPTIERLHAAIAAAGLAIRGPHHEIYVSDPNRTRPERLRTIIRRGIG